MQQWVSVAYLSPVRSEPKKLTTPTLNTKLEKIVNRPAIPAAHDNTPVRHTCTTHLYDTPVQHTCTTYLACHYISTYDTPVRHTCMTHLTCHTWHVCTARQHCQSNSNVILLLHYFSVLVFTASGLIVLHTGLPVDGDYVPRWNILSTQTIISHNTSQHHMVGVSASVNLSLHHKSPEVLFWHQLTRRTLRHWPPPLYNRSSQRQLYIQLN